MKGTKWTALLCALVLTCGMTVDAADFDAKYYAAHNPDVTAVVGEDAAALELHYHTFGAAEGRAANAEEAENGAGLISFEEFDAEYYAEHNPDVAEITGTDKAALYAHYVLFGAAEGRMARAVVEDPYARFASGESSGSHRSKSSKHSDASDSSNHTGSSGNSGSGSSGGTTATHTLSYTSNDDGTHTITCSVAGCTQSGHCGTESCSDFDYDYKALTSSLGNQVYAHAKICKDCHYSTDERCTPNTTYNTSQLKHVKKCTYCKGETAAWENHDWTNKDGKCPVCGFLCDHEFNYGTSSVCNRCGWDCPHSGGWEEGLCKRCQLPHSYVAFCEDKDGDNKCDVCGGDMP